MRRLVPALVLVAVASVAAAGPLRTNGPAFVSQSCASSCSAGENANGKGTGGDYSTVHIFKTPGRIDCQFFFTGGAPTLILQRCLEESPAKCDASVSWITVVTSPSTNATVVSDGTTTGAANGWYRTSFGGAPGVATNMRAICHVAQGS